MQRGKPTKTGSSEERAPKHKQLAGRGMCVTVSDQRKPSPASSRGGQGEPHSPPWLPKSSMTTGHQVLKKMGRQSDDGRGKSLPRQQVGAWVSPPLQEPGTCHSELGEARGCSPKPGQRGSLGLGRPGQAESRHRDRVNVFVLFL